MFELSGWEESLGPHGELLNCHAALTHSYKQCVYPALFGGTVGVHGGKVLNTEMQDPAV